MMIADVTPSVPFTTTGTWMLGLLGTLGAVYIILGVTIQVKKIFGRRPPIDEDLARRDAMLRAEIAAGDGVLLKRIDRMSDDFVSMQAERERNWKDLSSQIGDLREDMAFVRGQFEHRRKT